jgi:hypothetical protein
MNQFSVSFTEEEPLSQKKVVDKGRQRTKVTRGSGYKHMTVRDNVLNNLKGALQSYSSASDAEHSARSLGGMLYIENLNMEHMAATLHLYGAYQGDFNIYSGETFDPLADNGITPEMFFDDTHVMKRIRSKLEKTSRGVAERKDAWIRRKVGILGYLVNTIGYYADEETVGSDQGYSWISHAYKEEETRKREAEKAASKEAEITAEQDADESGGEEDPDRGLDEPADDF